MLMHVYIYIYMCVYNYLESWISNKVVIYSITNIDLCDYICTVNCHQQICGRWGCDLVTLEEPRPAPIVQAGVSSHVRTTRSSHVFHTGLQEPIPVQPVQEAPAVTWPCFCFRSQVMFVDIGHLEDVWNILICHDLFHVSTCQVSLMPENKVFSHLAVLRAGNFQVMSLQETCFWPHRSRTDAENLATA